MSKKVSVIIPIYNVESYIAECLDSIKKAIEKIPAEVILVDDGSTDNSTAVAEKFADREENFRYFRKINGGVGSARNYGAELAKGEYIVFVDPDDIVEDNYIVDMLVAAEDYNCEMVICDAARIKGSKISYSSLHRRTYYDIRDLQLNFENYPHLIYDSTSWNRIIRKDFYMRYKIFYPEGCRYEDYPVMQQMLILSNNTRFVRNWGYIWRIRTDGTASITKDHTNTKNLTDKIYTLEIARKFAKEHRMSNEYFHYLDYKILALEFNGTIAVLKDIPPKKALKHIDIIAKYIEDSVNIDVVSELPIYDQQKIDYILKRDLQGLFRLMNYKEINYDTAPVEKKGKNYEVSLPADIFKIPERNMRNEHAHTPYYQSVDVINVNEECICIHAHIYLRRVNVESVEDQEIKVSVANSYRDGEIELETINEMRPSLTKINGHVINADDYKDYYYNYDGTGFVAILNIDAITSDKRFRGKNFFLIECNNAMGHTRQLLRYASAKTKAQIKRGICIEKNGCRISITMNSVDVIEVVVEEYIAEDISIENEILSIAFLDPLHIRKPCLVSTDETENPIEVSCFDKEKRIYNMKWSNLEEGKYSLMCQSLQGKTISIKSDKPQNEKKKAKCRNKELVVETDDEGYVYLTVTQRDNAVQALLNNF